MDQMGSPYLLGARAGLAGQDAVTQVTFPLPGAYRVWVSDARLGGDLEGAGAPGKFQIKVDNGR
jgi:hypothetical protein